MESKLTIPNFTKYWFTVMTDALDFTTVYESYIKHSPLSEARHRKEMKTNRSYEAFVKSTTHDPRIKKRDLVSFILRPVRRLPQLRLQLESVQKRTPHDSEDYDEISTIVTVLGDCVKSAQPGIEAAESKVKFWGFMDNIVYTRDEAIVGSNLCFPNRTHVTMGFLNRIWTRTMTADTLCTKVHWQGNNDQNLTGAFGLTITLCFSIITVCICMCQS